MSSKNNKNKGRQSIKAEISTVKNDANVVARYKVKTTLGFEKRNYSIDGKNVLLIAGGEVDEDIYLSFNPKVRAAFFEI